MDLVFVVHLRHQVHQEHRQLSGMNHSYYHHFGFAYRSIWYWTKLVVSGYLALHVEPNVMFLQPPI